MKKKRKRPSRSIFKQVAFWKEQGLGEDSDGCIGARLGVSPRAVRYYRLLLGIPCYHAGRGILYAIIKVLHRGPKEGLSFGVLANLVRNDYGAIGDRALYTALGKLVQHAVLLRVTIDDRGGYRLLPISSLVDLMTIVKIIPNQSRLYRQGIRQGLRGL